MINPRDNTYGQEMGERDQNQVTIANQPCSADTLQWPHFDFNEYTSCSKELSTNITRAYLPDLWDSNCNYFHTSVALGMQYSWINRVKFELKIQPCLFGFSSLIALTLVSGSSRNSMNCCMAARAHRPSLSASHWGVSQQSSDWDTGLTVII